MFGCKECGRIWAPANNPRRCPACRSGTVKMTAVEAVQLATLRLAKLRERRRSSVT